MYREIQKADSKVERPHNPRCNANIFETITYSWMSNLLKIGRRRDLKETDLYTTLDDHTSSSLGDQLEKTWRSELNNANLANRKPTLFRALIRMFGAKYMFLGIVICILEIIFKISEPILLGELLEYFNPDKPKYSDIRYAYICASGLLISLFITTVIYYSTEQEFLNQAMKTRVACSSLIYRKALFLSTKALDETTVGQMINLISNDVNQFDLALPKLHYLWIGPLQTIVVTYLLWQEIGVSSLIGIATFFFFIPLQGWMGKKNGLYHLKTAKKTDERICLMNEIILGIQVIKMYTWEKPFSKLIEYLRKMEVKQIKGSIFIGFISLSFKVFQTRFQLFVSIILYILLGNHISVRKVYVLTSIYNILHFSMAVLFCLGLLQVGELIVSIKRIENFLLLGEKDKISKCCSKSDTSVENDVIQSLIVDDDITKNCKDFENNTKLDDDFSIVILNATAKWADDQNSNTLEKINLTARTGRLVAVVGSVGAGKSSLIQAVLRELPICDGRISVHGIVSYAPQEPWIFSGTVQQNILFGSQMDKERFQKIIDVCALKSDLEEFPLGDETIVGERGITLSGGQRARINLARAVYKQADIYLLDDPLSAVDVKVGKHLFEKCILDYLKEKTCILITHQVQYLSDVDQIVLMDNGKIVTEGSYNNLKAFSFEFANLLGYSEGSNIENEIETNNMHNNSADSRLVSSLNGSNNSIISSNYENQINDVQSSKPNKISSLQSYEYNSKNIFISYIKSGGSTPNILFCIFMCIFTQVLTTSGDFWLSIWVNHEVYEYHKLLNTSYSNNMSVPSDSNSASLLLSNFQRHYVMIYVILMVSLIVTAIIRSAVFVNITTKASINLHNQMFNSIIRTTMFFFNTNSTGQILNRFSKDMGAVDKTLPNIFMDFIQIVFFILGTLFIVALTNIYLLIPTFIMGIIIYKLRYLHFNTSQGVRRLEGETRSPVLAHMNASLQGLTTIRAFRAENILSREFDKHQDLHTSASYLCTCLNQGFGFWLDIICIIYLCIVISSFLVVDNNIYGGSVGIALTQAMALLGRIQWAVKQSTALENLMVPVERILQYTHLPQEDTLHSTTVKSQPKVWPYAGKIVFKDFNLRYSSDSPYVLKNLNIQIQTMEKVGIVGRTGAGKSSFIGALFRLALNEGKIIIDGIDIHELELNDLRSKLSIIPQEPVLFSGTMRTNIDPFDEYPDHALWNALDEVELKEFVEDLPDGLNSKISASGSNFSVGQRQLVCLARAIVQKNKILILDEATANVDPITDKLIQNTIRNKFRFCTVLTIAHRLNTIMDSDKVLVMDFGKIIEFDHPYSLLKNTDGFFYKMVEETGKDTAFFLHSVAFESFKKVRTPVG
ncbi:LOW QUALITY PROTEIN: ATP-binding cassette sub-family C member 4-like [Metopolophium dirhodum]|uniref:LOW QUALITY PROTEIN: ATP-binding cassette sub-family C member 4-like n=1 Tax=Metopolophium dirhodum TaxID=44670 RepID=UPI0029905C50|nr:LOW QUALITY PROTEIN: ATP-binding cassette sub-family C member 4-like [Metopolophium dirhodum]